MRNWLPNQHGAWAFVITPVVVGAIISEVNSLHALLLLGWLSAYCFNFYVGLTVKGWRRADRWSRYRAQQLVYGSVAAACAAPVLIAHPQLLSLAPALLAVFAANLWFIRSKNERAWLNDLLGVVAAVLMGWLSAWLGVASITSLQVGIISLVGAYFAGTVWYVKTMIREKGRAGWLWVSRIWHIAFAALAAVIMPWFLINAVPAALRAWLLPGRPLNPKQVGFIEIGLTLLAVLAASLTA